jgi:TatD DNase family protein
MLIDTHCHYDLAPNPIAFIRECEQEKIITIGMTNLPSHFEQGYPYVNKDFRFIRLALGLHPLKANNHNDELAVFTRNVNKTSYIGEVGLDFSKQGIETKSIQLESFEFVLKSIMNKGKIVSIHSREAEKEVLELLNKYKIKNVILHWYTGGIVGLREAINRDYHFSINSAMIRSKKGQRIISGIPLGRVLTETDYPYTFIKGKSTKSKDIKEVINYLAYTHNISCDDIQKVIYLNFKEITGTS